MRRFLLLFSPIFILAIAAALDLRPDWNWVLNHVGLVIGVLAGIIVLSAAIICYAAIHINYNREDDCLTPPGDGTRYPKP